VVTQLVSLLQIDKNLIITAPTSYNGIMLIFVDEMVVASLNSIRNVEALLVDEVTAAELLQPSAPSEASSFKSLDGVDAREQYNHLSQLLHIHKATRNKR